VQDTGFASQRTTGCCGVSRIYLARREMSLNFSLILYATAHRLSPLLKQAGQVVVQGERGQDDKQPDPHALS
jgi:hypothetical protein